MFQNWGAEMFSFWDPQEINYFGILVLILSVSTAKLCKYHTVYRGHSRYLKDTVSHMNGFSYE